MDPLEALRDHRPNAEQRRALAKDPQGRRRVVLSTALAESSVTVDGVRKLGVEKVPPMVTRGVVLDMTTYYCKAIVPGGTEFTVADIQAVLKKYDMLFCADEVINGFGRTGNVWGCQTMNITPDILTCAKALSASFLPISAVMVNDRVYQALMTESDKIGVWGHGFTYSGHPVAAAVAMETQKIYDEIDLFARMSAAGDRPLNWNVLTVDSRVPERVPRDSLLTYVPIAPPVPDRRVILIYRKSFPRKAAIEAVHKAILDCPLSGAEKLDLPAH